MLNIGTGCREERLRDIVFWSFYVNCFLNWLKWNVQSFEPLIFINIGSSSYLFYDNCFQRFSVCINRPVAISLAVIICKLFVFVILTIVVHSIVIIN